MHRNKGNTAGRKPRCKAAPTPAQLAIYIAESIEAKEEAGIAWSFSDYGIADKAEMVAMVNERLER